MDCPECHGLGRVYRKPEAQPPCPVCGSSGPCAHRWSSATVECKRCKGTGSIRAPTAKPRSPQPSGAADAWWATYAEAERDEKALRAADEERVAAGERLNQAWQRLWDAVPDEDGPLLDALLSCDEAFVAYFEGVNRVMEIDGKARSDLIALINQGRPPA